MGLSVSMLLCFNCTRHYRVRQLAARLLREHAERVLGLNPDSATDCQGDDGPVPPLFTPACSSVGHNVQPLHGPVGANSSTSGTAETAATPFPAPEPGARDNLRALTAWKQRENLNR